jgi:hypothetical protein
MLKRKIVSPAILAALSLLLAASTSAQNAQLQSQDHSARAAGREGSSEGKSQAKGQASPAATQTCSYQFTSGSGQTYLQFCVSVNGNIVQFQSPAGVEQLNQDGAHEGYGICDEAPNTGYYDYANADSGNWNAPALISKTASMVKIERTTTDGAWTLTQTITSSAGPNPYAKIVMQLKNNSSLDKIISLYRYADPVPDAAAMEDNFAENYDGDNNGAWGYAALTSDTPYGLMLQKLGDPTPAPITLYDSEGFAYAGDLGPTNPCFIHASSTIQDGLGSTMMFYVMTLGKEKSVTVTDRYISF